MALEDVPLLVAELGGPSDFNRGRGAGPTDPVPLANDLSAVGGGGGAALRGRRAAGRTGGGGGEVGGVDALRAALDGYPGATGGRGGEDPPHETGDARTLPVRYDSSGARSRGFKEAVDLCSQSEIPGFLVRAHERPGGC